MRASVISVQTVAHTGFQLKAGSQDWCTENASRKETGVTGLYAESTKLKKTAGNVF